MKCSRNSLCAGFPGSTKLRPSSACFRALLCIPRALVIIRRQSKGYHLSVALLKIRPAIAARALELTILTAARTSETLNATWFEIDMTE